MFGHAIRHALRQLIRHVFRRVLRPVLGHVPSAWPRYAGSQLQPQVVDIMATCPATNKVHKFAQGVYMCIDMFVGKDKGMYVKTGERHVYRHVCIGMYIDMWYVHPSKPQSVHR